MRTYERNGVLIDQCDDCRGIFLDRGEIERLIDAGSPPEEPDSRPGRRRRTTLPANAPLTVDGLGRDQQAYAAR
jgi:Zn-finger nucleic acid-binding protein